MTYESPVNIGLFSVEAENILNAFLNFLKKRGEYRYHTSKGAISTRYCSRLSPRTWRVGYACKISRATNNELQLAFINDYKYYGPVSGFSGYNWNRSIYNCNTDVYPRNNAEVIKWLGSKLWNTIHIYLEQIDQYDNDMSVSESIKHARKEWRVNNNHVCQMLTQYNIDEKGVNLGDITIGKLYALSVYLLGKKNLVKRLKKNAKTKAMLDKLLGEEYDPFLTAQEDNRRKEIERINNELRDKVKALQIECQKTIDESSKRLNLEFGRLIEAAKAEAARQIKELNDMMEELKSSALAA